MSTKITRKEFLMVMAGLGLASAACAGDDGGGDGEGGTAGGCDSVDVTIGTNHDHSVTVPAADVEAGAAMSYTLTGGGHEHTFTVSGTNMMRLQNGEDVTDIQTSGGGTHEHGISLSCA